MTKNKFLIMMIMLLLFCLSSCSKGEIRQPDYVSQQIVDSLPKEAAIEVLKKTLGKIVKEKGLNLAYYEQSMFSMHYKETVKLIEYEELYFFVEKNRWLSAGVCGTIHYFAENPSSSFFFVDNRKSYATSKIKTCDDARNAATALISLGASPIASIPCRMPLSGSD